MACDITSGRAKPCKKQLGGVSKLYLFNWLDAPFTFASGVASAMNVALTESFEYDLSTLGADVLLENGVGDEAAGTFVNTQTVTAILQGVDAATQNEMKLLAQGRVSAVIKSNNGDYHLVGDTDGVNFNIDATSGSTHAEFSGYTLTGSSIENKYSPILDSATVTAFLAVVTAN